MTIYSVTYCFIVGNSHKETFFTEQVLNNEYITFLWFSHANIKQKSNKNFLQLFLWLFYEIYQLKVKNECIKHHKNFLKERKLSSDTLFSKYVLSGDYMIPVCRDEISSPDRFHHTIT